MFVAFSVKISMILPKIEDGYELIIIIVSNFGQAVAGNSPGVSIIGLLFVWRFFVRALPFQGVH